MTVLVFVTHPEGMIYTRPNPALCLTQEPHNVYNIAYIYRYIVYYSINIKEIDLKASGSWG